jgi:hypothetical protein
LTIPNVKSDVLPETIETMTKNLTNIIRVLREKRKINISGIRKIEVTYNQQKDDYHPHFHILHNQDVGEMIISEWLKRNPTAKKQGWDRKSKSMVNLQVTKPVTKQGDDDRKYLNELFKYASKFIVKDDKERNLLNIYIPALDNILRALHTKRTIQSFGIIKKLDIDKPDEELELIAQELIGISQDEKKQWVWGLVDEVYDWIDFEGNRLTNYQPPDIEFRYYLGDALPPTQKEISRMKKGNNFKITAE